MTVLSRIGPVLLTLFAAGIALAQSAPPPAQEYKQKITGALGTAKKAADALNVQHKVLLAALKEASDATRAQKVLDDLLASTTKALAGFKEGSEVMTQITSLLSFIDAKRAHAETLVADPDWKESAHAWRSEGDSIRELRQKILLEVDRGNQNLEKLKKKRVYIEDVIAREGVARAREEMEKALLGLKVLGDTIGQAVDQVEKRPGKIPGG